MKDSILLDLIHSQTNLRDIWCKCITVWKLLLKLKLQYFGHLMQRVDSLEKTLMLGRIGGRRRRGQQKMRWLDGITNSMDMGRVDSGSCDGQGGLACCNSWGHKELDMTEWLNWTEQNYQLLNDLQYLCQVVKASSIKSAADIRAVLKWFSWDSAGLQAFFYQDKWDKWDSQFKYIPASIHSLNTVKISLSLHLPIIYPPS